MDGAKGNRDRVLLSDVARQANVSDSTASRSLSNDPRISQRTRERVKAAAAELHYVPNAAARSLRVRRTRTLGLLLPDIRDPVHGQVASAFEEQARAEGYCVIVVAGERDLVRERLALRIFAEHGTDGVAVVASALTPRELRERVDPDRLVLCWPDHRTMPRHEGPVARGVIQTDDASGVRQAVNHLIDLGCRRIAYADGGPSGSNTIRAETTVATVRQRGIRIPVRTYVAADPFRRAAEIAGQIAAGPPDAVVCYDDKLAIALIDALRDHGLSVPRDVAVVGFDGIPFAEISNPRLTTVSVPTAELGRQAAALLIRAIHEGVLPDGVLLPVQVVLRESTGTAAAVHESSAEVPA